MKKVEHPSLTSARALSMLELNDIKFSNERTIITADEMAAMGDAHLQMKGADG